MARIRHLVLLSLTALSIAAEELGPLQVSEANTKSQYVSVLSLLSLVEETQWSTVRVKGDGRGDGHAHVIGDVGTATVTVSQASQAQEP